MNKRRRKLIAAIVFLVFALAVLSGASYAWFALHKSVNLSPFSMPVTDKAFTMGDFKVIADGKDQSVNEFSGLLPGSVFRFELLVQRKISGDINLKLEIQGVKGEDFEGKDGVHNMKELFCVVPLDSNDNPIGEERYFSECDESGTLLLFSSVSMPSQVDELVLTFRIRFSADRVGMENLSNVINRKKFMIGAMYVSLA